MADERFQCLGELCGLKISGVNSVMKQGHGSKNCSNRKHGGKESTKKCIEAARVDIAWLHSLVDNRALLKEKHPGRDGRADGGQDHNEDFVAVSAGQSLPRDHAVSDGMPSGTRQDCHRNEEPVKDSQAQSD